MSAPGPAGRNLALVVSTAPERGDLERALALARAGCELDMDVSLFFMDQAVHGLVAARPYLDALAELGCELIACATSATAAGLHERDLGTILLGSQDDHAAMVHRAHRVIAFT